MSFEFVIDSYAWIEYFLGSGAGKKVRRYVEGENSATPTMVIAELSRKLLQKVRDGAETDEGRAQKLEFVKSSTVVVVLDGDTATLAGDQADELREQIHDSLLRASETLKLTEDSLRERGQAAVTATEDYVQANPWQSVGIAAGVGFLIGLLASRR